jgi:hypothetical protein
MRSLTSPKINAGVHCLNLHTKSMYINAVVDPDGLTLRQVRQLCVLVRGHSDGSDPTASPFEQISAVANAVLQVLNLVSRERRTVACGNASGS